MFRTLHCLPWLALGVLLLAAAPVRAENEGMPDLEEAMAAKIDAQTLTDFGKVIRLCESALEKGLDESNREFAQQLLAATLSQRGLVVAKTILMMNPPDRRWPAFREVALKDLEKSVAIDKNQPEALLYVARLNLLPGGDAKRATEAIDQAVEAASEESNYLSEALVLRATLSSDKAKQRADLDAAIQAAPQNAAALRARGLLRSETEDLEGALADFNQALELDEDHAPTLEAKALVLAQQKKYDEAIAILDQARILQPEAAWPLVQKGRVYALQEKYDEALQQLEKALGLEPEDVSALLLRASIYHEQDQKEKALADVDKALEIRPGLPQAVRVKAMLLAGDDKLDLAIAELEKLRQTDPQDSISLLQLGMFYTSQEDYPKAIETFTAAVESEPDSWLALRGRADAYLQVGKHAEAIADYEKASQLNPEEAGIFNNLAWVLATSPKDEIRNGTRAIELAKKAAELTDYKAAYILSTLAAAYAETGDFDAAIEWSEKALAAADEDLREPLQKELDSFRQKKPWREDLSQENAEKKEKEDADSGESADKPGQETPADTKSSDGQ